MPSDTTYGQRESARKALSELSPFQLAYKSLPGYVALQHPSYRFAKHNLMIADALTKVENGTIDRLIINMPPRHGKTMLASEYFPAWYLGRNPSAQVIFAAYSYERAGDCGRKVRNQMVMPIHKQVFKACSVSKDAAGQNRMTTDQGGYYFALGVSGGVVGRGANLFIIDDPIRGREDADSEIQRRKLEDWYRGVAYTRLMPQNAIILIMCVAKGERVLMGDGSWKSIENITVKDSVIGYENGKPVRKKVTKISQQNKDDIVQVVSRSCSLKVNRKHPFLVIHGGLKKSAKTQNDIIESRKWDLEWVCAGDLNPGDSVVTIKKLDRGNWYRPTSFKKPEIMNQKDYWLFGFLFGDGWIINNNKRGVVGFCVADSDKPELDQQVHSIIKDRLNIKMKPTKHGYHRADARKQGRWLSDMGLCSGAKKKRLPEWVFKLRPCDKREFLEGFFAADGWKQGKNSYTVCIANKFLLDDLRLVARTCGFKTTKIYEYHGEKQPPNSPEKIKFINYLARFYNKYNKIELKKRYGQQDNLGRFFRIEDIEKIEPIGQEVVYDLTVEGAESFIAEGYVVHNTRWHFNDLAGMLVEEMKHEGWAVLTLPAIAEEDDDIIGRKIGEALWPSDFPVKRLDVIKETVGSREWNAQYQQTPIPSTGGMINIDDFKRYNYAEDWLPTLMALKAGATKIDPSSHPIKQIVMSWDTAFKEAQINDPSAGTIWGITKEHNLYLLETINQRLAYPKLKKLVVATWERYMKIGLGPIPVLIEDRASGQSLIQDLKRSTPIPIIAVKATSEKQVRMEAGTPLIEAGRVYLPNKPMSWVIDYETQLARFPLAKFDDLVDSTSQFLLWVSKPRYRKTSGRKFWK